MLRIVLRNCLINYNKIAFSAIWSENLKYIQRNNFFNVLN